MDTTNNNITLAPNPQPAMVLQSQSPPTQSFDDMFVVEYERLTKAQFPNGYQPVDEDHVPDDHGAKPQPKQEDRRRIIKQAYNMVEYAYYPPGIVLGPAEKQQKALTRVLYNVMADEPWRNRWIRGPDVERKLSRFEWAPDSYALAETHNFKHPINAIVAARKELQELAAMSESKGKEKAYERAAPFDDIEVIYVPGTVSSDATNAINRNEIYPISVESVAYQLEYHMCKTMTRPWEEAFRILHMSSIDPLLQMRNYGLGIIDFAPHLLDNDNISLLLVLLIVPRNEICTQFLKSGIRVEGSTMSHRKSELMKHNLGWITQDDKWGFDTAATELQKKIKAVIQPKGKANRPRKYTKSSTASTPATTPAPAMATNGGTSNGVQGPIPPGYGGFFGYGGIGANYQPPKSAQ